jgi:pimeloyl-ACP methyl ester carboxylesterase
MNFAEISADGPTARPLVLVHGLGATRRHWESVAPQLAADRRVVAVDLPGFGESPRGETFSVKRATSQLTALIRRLGLEECCLVGHSMGGLVVLSMAHTEPDLVGRIVLVDAQLLSLYDILRRPHTFGRHPAPALAILAMLVGGAVPGRGPLAAATADSTLLRRLFYWPVTRRPAQLDPELLRSAYASATNRGIYGAVAELRRIDPVSLFDRPAVPTAMIWGDDDRLIGPGDTERARSELGDPPGAAIENCGHLPMLESPDALVRLVRDFST